MKGTSPSRGCGEVSANGNKCHNKDHDVKVVFKAAQIDLLNVLKIDKQ